MLDNHLLERVSETLLLDIRRRLKPLDFVQGDCLAEPDTPIDMVMFPRSGLISIVVPLDDGDQIEAGWVGCRGALGGSVTLGAEQHFHRAVVRLAGRAWSMRAADAREIASTSAEFRKLMVAQEQRLLAQARQLAGCNAIHRIVQRLCFWLLRAQAETGGSELHLTQDNLAKMLGVQRASLSMYASQLQEDGLISYRRGRVRILDVHGLTKRACTCHHALEEQYQHLFAVPMRRRDIPPGEGPDDRPLDGPPAH